MAIIRFLNQITKLKLQQDLKTKKFLNKFKKMFLHQWGATIPSCSMWIIQWFWIKIKPKLANKNFWEKVKLFNRKWIRMSIKYPQFKWILTIMLEISLNWKILKTDLCKTKKVTLKIYIK